MDWKKRYEKLTIGDRVKIIKYHPHCGSDPRTCCINSGYEIGNICTVTRFTKSGNLVLFGGCGFPKECLEKV